MTGVIKSRHQKIWGAVSFFVTILLVVSVAAPGCAREEIAPPKPVPSPTAAPMPKATEMVFGALLSRTGSLSSLGQSAEAALEIAVADINEYLSGIGSPARVRLLVEDTKTDPAVALEKLKVLANRGIRVVFGPGSSAEAKAVKGYADENGIILICQWSTAPSLAVPEDNVFRFVPDDTHQAEAVTRLMWEDKIRAVIPVWRGDTWGDDISKAIKTKFNELGGTVYDGVRYESATADFAPVLTSAAQKVAQATAQYGAESVAVVLEAFEEAALIFVQAQKHPNLSSVRWYGSDATALVKELVSNPEAARFALLTGFPNPLYGEEDNYKYRLIKERIQGKIGRTPDSYALAGYDAVWVAALSNIVSGLTGDPVIIKKALVQTAQSYFGATGWTALNDAGDRKSGSYDFWAIREDKGTSQWKRVGRYQVDPGLPGKVTTEMRFPSRPIRVITGWLGGTEQFLQAISGEAGKILGMPVTVVNKVGNDGLDAALEFQASARDGYTLLSSLDFYAAYYAQGKIESNPAEDWIPILTGNLAITQIYIRADEKRYGNWDELVAYAKARPGLKIATIGTPLDLEGLSIAGLERGFGIRFQQVPFGKSPERNASLMGGESDLLIDQPGDIMEFLNSGKFKPILTLWNERIKGFENIPTVREKGADISPLLRLRGLAVPKGTPQDRIDVLKAAFQSAFNSEAYQKYLKERMLDLVPYPKDPVATVRQEIETYQRLYRDASTTTMEVRVGQEFSLTVDSNRTTGYQWQLGRPLDETILKLVSSEYRALQPAPGLVGAGRQEVWTFKAVGKGRTEISLKYVHPWEKDAKPAKEQSYTVVVK